MLTCIQNIYKRVEQYVKISYAKSIGCSAFFVKVNKNKSTENTIYVDISFIPSVPAEYIKFEFTLTPDGTSIK